MSLSIADILIRLGIAIVVGFLIGLERESHQRPAGIKTHILVCMGATVVSIVQLEIIADVIRRVSEDPSLTDVLKADYGRLGAQVISGIGFLGAGTILRTKGSVRGLTTAATLWIVACLGLGIGMGHYVVSIAAFLLIMGVLTLLRLFQKFILNRQGVQSLELLIVEKKDTMEKIAAYFESNFIQIQSIDFSDEPEEHYRYGAPVIRCTYLVTLPRTIGIRDVINTLSMENNIVKIGQSE
jgi:putative Mg2+ transporter-C (MgtC) family protein